MSNFTQVKIDQTTPATTNKVSLGSDVVLVDGSGATQPVSGSVTVSGTVTANQGTAGAAYWLASSQLVDESGVAYGVKHVSNKPRVSSMPYTYDIAEGNVSGHTAWSKIGFNAAIGATEEMMWPISTAYTWPTAELTMTIASDSAKDCQRALTAFANSANHPGVNTLVTCAAHGLADGDIVVISGTTSYNGTFTIEHTVAGAFEIIKAYVANDATGTVRGPGANTVTVYYLDDAFAEKNVTVTMLGTTTVTIATDIYRVQNTRVATVGTSLVPVGNLTIASAGTTYGYISAGRTRARRCAWTVPAGKVLYVTQIAFSCSDQAASKMVRFTTKANLDNLSGVVLQRGLFMPFNEVTLNNTAYNRTLDPPTKLIATVDLMVTAMSNSAAQGSCSLRGWLESA